jgi:hypothetical protein
VEAGASALADKQRWAGPTDPSGAPPDSGFSQTALQHHASGEPRRRALMARVAALSEQDQRPQRVIKPYVLQLARSGFDQLQVLGQERPAESRVRMPLTCHERMFAWMRPTPSDEPGTPRAVGTAAYRPTRRCAPPCGEARVAAVWVEQASRPVLPLRPVRARRRLAMETTAFARVRAPACRWRAHLLRTTSSSPGVAVWAVTVARAEYREFGAGWTRRWTRPRAQAHGIPRVPGVASKTRAVQCARRSGRRAIQRVHLVPEGRVPAATRGRCEVGTPHRPAVGGPSEAPAVRPRDRRSSAG